MYYMGNVFIYKKKTKKKFFFKNNAEVFRNSSPNQSWQPLKSLHSLQIVKNDDVMEAEEE